MNQAINTRHAIEVDRLLIALWNGMSLARVLYLALAVIDVAAANAYMLGLVEPTLLRIVLVNCIAMVLFVLYYRRDTAASLMKGVWLGPLVYMNYMPVLAVLVEIFWALILFGGLGR